MKVKILRNPSLGVVARLKELGCDADCREGTTVNVRQDIAQLLVDFGVAESDAGSESHQLNAVPGNDIEGNGKQEDKQGGKSK